MSFKNPFEQSLRRAAHALPQETVPAALQARVLSTLPPSTPNAKRRQFLSRLVVTGAVAATVVIGGVIAPRYFVARSYAAEMRQAIAHARTWHFTGWRLVDGKRVPWEVWGRRSPFLYRETIGDEIVYDDGTRRIHVLPPDTLNGRDRGTYLVTASEQLKRTAPQGAGFLAGVGAENLDFRSFVPATDNAGVLRTEATTYISMPEESIREQTRLDISATTFLPIHYTVTHDPISATTFLPIPHLVTHDPDHRIAELKPTYDTPFPRTLADVPVPPEGYAVADATTSSDLVPSSDAACTRNGLTLQASVIGQDAEGNIHVRFSGWIGGEPMRREAQGLILEQNQLAAFKAEDAQGNRYVSMGTPPWTVINADHPELWLTPIEPIHVDPTNPTHLELKIAFQLSRYERLGNTGRTIKMVGEDFTFALALPANPAPLGWDAVENSEGMEFVGVRPTFRMGTAEKRGYYYLTEGSSSGAFTQTPGGPPLETEDSKNRKRAALERAAYWYRIVEAEAQRTRNTMMLDRARSSLRSVREMTDALKAL